MSLKEKLQSDLKEAMRAKENFRRDVIRLINSSIKQIEVDERRELSDEDVIKILQKSAKQRNDSITQYKNGNREDLAEKESNELKIIESYLPKQLEDSELEDEIKKVIAETGASSIKDMGKVMGVASKKLAGKADGKRVSEVVKRLL